MSKETFFVVPQLSWRCVWPWRDAPIENVQDQQKDVWWSTLGQPINQRRESWLKKKKQFPSSSSALHSCVFEMRVPLAPTTASCGGGGGGEPGVEDGQLFIPFPPQRPQQHVISGCRVWEEIPTFCPSPICYRTSKEANGSFFHFFLFYFFLFLYDFFPPSVSYD